jgi:hypothetical protein
VSEQDTTVNAETPYGFTFGAAAVTRLGIMPDGATVIRVETPRGHIDIRVTRTGQLRVFHNHDEKLRIR